MDTQEVKELIESGIDDAEVEVQNQDHEYAEEGTHFGIVIVSSSFEDKSTVERHRMVYKALGDKMKNEIHAVEIKALTPDEV